MRADGTARLILLSDSPDNLSFAARTLARLNVQEVGITPYWAVARQLADRNVDVSLAAFRLLEYPDIRMNFVSTYGLNQSGLVISLLLAIDERYWGDSAIERLRSEQDETSMKTLLRLLWYLQSDFADAEMKRFAEDARNPSSARDLAAELISREPSVSDLDRVEVLNSSEEELHESRRRRQTRLFYENMLPYIERDTMKILLKRRLVPAQQ